MTDRITRRGVLGASAGVLTLGYLSGSTTDDEGSPQPDLFVFRGCDAESFVAAVVAPAIIGRRAPLARFDARARGAGMSTEFVRCNPGSCPNGRIAGCLQARCSGTGRRSVRDVRQS